MATTSTTVKMDIRIGIMPLFMVVILAVITLCNAQTRYVRPSHRPTNNYPPNPTMNFGNRATAPQRYPTNPTPPQPYPRHPPPIQPRANYPPPAPQYTQPAAQPRAVYQPPTQQYSAPSRFPSYNPFMSGGQGMPNCSFMCKMTGKFEINPRCGYDGKTHRNECYLRCAGTVEACDGTCPCYGSISNNGFLPPSAGVFPGKGPKPIPRGRRKECFCPFTNEVSCTEDKRTMSDCEAYCTYRSVTCERPCGDPRCGGFRRG